jgi:hypothetical protein
MASKLQRGNGWPIFLLVGLMSVMMLGRGGCAGEPPKPAPTVTSDQVRSHADKAVEKLKQEEQERATDLSVKP